MTSTVSCEKVTSSPDSSRVAVPTCEEIRIRQCPLSFRGPNPNSVGEEEERGGFGLTLTSAKLPGLTNLTPTGKKASGSEVPDMENSSVPEGSSASMVSVVHSRQLVTELTVQSPVLELTLG